MPLNKGGRLEGKVTEVSGSTFTVELEGKGHQYHGEEIEFPISAWNGRGAEVGQDKGYDKPKEGPRHGDRVIVNTDEKAKAAVASEDDN